VSRCTAGVSEQLLTLVIALPVVDVADTGSRERDVSIIIEETVGLQSNLYYIVHKAGYNWRCREGRQYNGTK
jgi:hypothetical protein